jgi:hypothetical protein
MFPDTSHEEWSAVNKKQIKIRGQLGATIRHRPEDQDAADQLRLELKASRAEDYISDLLDADPPLTESQRARLAGLLAVGGGQS